MPLIQNQVVTLHKWITLSQFSDLVLIAEMTPGPIALNAATFVGTQVAGLGGAIIATMGVVVPSVLVTSLFAYLYFRYKGLFVMQGLLAGLRLAVIALITSAALSIIILTFYGEAGFSLAAGALDYIAVALFAVSLILMRKFKVNPIAVMIGCGVVGGAIYYFV